MSQQAEPQEPKNTEQALVLSHTALDMLKVEENRIDNIIEKRKIILKLIAKHIRPTEIRLFGDNLHFERAACEQILSWAGARVENVHKEVEIITDDEGTYRDYEMWGTVRFGDDRSLEVMGNCSTRSDFYGVRKGKDGKEYYLPLHEVDIPSIKQAAMTNMMNHACVRSLGLKAITLEDLKMAGMNVDMVKKVEFNKGSRGGSTLTPDEIRMQTQIGNWVLEMAGGDKESAASTLMARTTFKGSDNAQVPGKRSPSELTGRRLQITHEKIAAEYKAWRVKNKLPEIQEPAQAAPSDQGQAR